MTVYTAGYEGSTISQFLTKLSDKKIDTVIDIRQRPFSRKPGFSRGKLTEHLADSGIKYFHFAELGTPAPLRDFLREKGDYEEFFRRYSDFIVEFEDSLYDIVDMSRRQKICIVCFEKDPHLCHRKVIVDLLNSRCGGNIE